MILQVNKVKKELDVSKFLNSEGFVTNECIKHDKIYKESELSLEEYLEDKIENETTKIFYRNEFGRKTGKTTLINELANKYNLPIIVPIKFMKNFYDTFNVFAMDSQRLDGRGIKIALVDEISYVEYRRLITSGIIPIGFINDNYNFKKEVFEDYVEISSIIKLKNGIKARAKQYDMCLLYDKEFCNDSYGIDNRGFYIDSVYLLDDTGKTIKKIM